MKTAFKLVLIYYLFQLLGTLTASPLAMLYVYVTTGQVDTVQATQLNLAPALLLGMVYMFLYLWQTPYLKQDSRLYHIVSFPVWLWSLLGGCAVLFGVDALASQFTFLPDLMQPTFDTLQMGWLGIFCLTLLGPVLEECLFRGVITKVLLRDYPPYLAIVLSGLLFGLFHVNPSQVLSASLAGFFFAWLYYRTGSLLPDIVLHIYNNSLSVWLNRCYPDIDSLPQLFHLPWFIGFLLAIPVLLLSVYQLNRHTRVCLN